MPNFKFIGALPRFYPDERDASGKSLMAELGTVHDWAVQPSDGQWTETDEAPQAPAVVVPEPAPEPPAPEPAPVPAPPASEPAPAPVATPEPVQVPEPEPVPVTPEPAPAPPAPEAPRPAFQFPGFAPASQPYTR